MSESSEMLWHRRRHGRPARFVIAVCVGAALATIAGCASGHAGTPTARGHASGGAVSAGEALSLAASQSAKVTSMVATVSMTSTGTGAGAGFAGTISVQFRPRLLSGITLEFPSASGGGSLREVFTSKAIYLNLASLAAVTGKPWVKMSLSALPRQSSAAIASAFQSLERDNPLSQARLFKASKNVHVVGKQTISGVPTTEYAGSYRPAAALAGLPAALRGQLGPMLRALGNQPMSFHVWIDGQHLVRKTATSEKVDGQTMNVVYVVKSVNQPVVIKLPDPSQVRSISSLSSLG